MQDRGAQGLVQGADLDHQPAGEARAHPLVEGFQLRRRPVGRHHHLAPGIDKGVEGVAELAWIERPWMNCTSSRIRTSIARSFSLKASALWVFTR